MTINPYKDPSRLGGSIQTYTGLIFYPLDPRLDDINLVDVAHGLSNKCRFTGHTSRFYSTAEHSCRVSCYLEDIGATLMQQYCGLHHDDTDAYLPDVPTPLKRLPEFEWFRKLEHDMQELCYKRFNCVVDDYKIIKKADVVMLFAEKRDLMPKVNSQWDPVFEETDSPYSYKIKPLPPEKAEYWYLERHYNLTKKLGIESKITVCCL